MAASLMLVYELRLSEVDALKEALPKKQRKDNQVLQRCHQKFHGAECVAADCVVVHPELLTSRGNRAGLLRDFSKELRSAERKRLTDMERAHARIRFDFRAGTAQLLFASCKQEPGMPQTGMPQTGMPQTTRGLPKQRAKRGMAEVAPAVGMEFQCEEGCVRVRLHVSGPAALKFGSSSSKLPRRTSAAAAASSRARSEQELDQAVDAAEAGESERVLSWQLSQQLDRERAEKERLAEEKAALETCPRSGAPPCVSGASTLAYAHAPPTLALCTLCVYVRHDGCPPWCILLTHDYLIKLVRYARCCSLCYVPVPQSPCASVRVYLHPRYSRRYPHLLQHFRPRPLYLFARRVPYYRRPRVESHRPFRPQLHSFLYLPVIHHPYPPY